MFDGSVDAKACALTHSLSLSQSFYSCLTHALCRRVTTISTTIAMMMLLLPLLLLFDNDNGRADDDNNNNNNNRFDFSKY